MYGVCIVYILYATLIYWIDPTNLIEYGNKKVLH